MSNNVLPWGWGQGQGHRNTKHRRKVRHLTRNFQSSKVVHPIKETSWKGPTFETKCGGVRQDKREMHTETIASQTFKLLSVCCFSRFCPVVDFPANFTHQWDSWPSLSHDNFDHLAPVVHRVDRIIRWINCYPAEEICRKNSI